MAYFLYLSGLGLGGFGLLLYRHAASAMHEIHAAIFLTGGMIVLGLGCICEVLAEMRKLKKEEMQAVAARETA